MTPNNFQIGDKVRLITTLNEPNGEYEKIKRGSFGVVCRIAHTGSIGVSFYDYTGGHDCNQSCQNGTGLYIKPQYLEKIPKSIEEEFKELNEML